MNEVFDSSAFGSEMDRLTGSVERRGNACLFLPSGVQSYRERWRLLAGAKHQVHAVAFSVMNDDTSRRMASEMRRLARSGAQARLILDDGVYWTTFCGKILESIEDGGGEVLHYHKLFRDLLPDLSKGRPFHQIAHNVKLKLKRHFHEKYMVVDGTAAVLGGLNWGDKYALGGQEPKAWRDTDVLLTGPVVADIQDRFVTDWYRYQAQNEQADNLRRRGFDPQECIERWRNQELADRDAFKQRWFPNLEATGDLPIRYVAHKPWDENRGQLTNAMLHVIDNAKETLWWGCHGIRPPRMLAEALIKAAARGVDVRLFTNSKVSAQTLMLRGLFGWMYWESSNHYKTLLEGGIRIFEWQKPGAFHSKNMVADSRYASVGSYNIANGSCFHHTESNVFIRDRAFAEQVAAQFEIDTKDCLEITLAQAKTPSAKHDPFLRPLRDRCFIVDPGMWPKSVAEDLAAGKFLPF
ncbi:MAG: phosphatidylserine/phosphatidylglycerophosphate/cardiolipin synthase family protein [Fibrobacterota bacterium]|nr:phosphatidylserine/phosphatidylglycerophosphate/cardiolipin synthase family protein [Fibrobacterota bacterium]QQS07531.1 MAG: phosphatidylserine/phosphatidylglycerophosphate/cardiolipin synthase family protein [Fibrobacterota bacterium]